jgi:putative PEP-CTERM system histidine kinase
VQVLSAAEGPLDVAAFAPGEQDRPAWKAFLESSRAVLVAPVRSQGELMGFLALGPDRAGAYETDDRNLLRAMTHHAGVLLSHARLARERREAAELEALHRLSAFCVHDLKNLAASLSLVARNAQTHGPDPAFQESALRTVARTADKIMALVHRLSRRSPEGAALAAPVDVNQAIEETLASLDGPVRASVRREGGLVPQVATQKEELHQVLLNLVLNAADALQDVPSDRPGDRIVIRTAAQGDVVLISVADRGQGLGPEALRTLFQPFRTTKSGGLGLGLYECKRIVEAHRGHIRVESEPGRGTEFLVELPAWRPPAGA